MAGPHNGEAILRSHHVAPTPPATIATLPAVDAVALAVVDQDDPPEDRLTVSLPLEPLDGEGSFTVPSGE